jgi:hypothetical protein
MFLQVVAQLLVRFQEYVLHDVGGVHARRQPMVETDGDHLPQAVAVAVEEPGPGGHIPATDLGEQPVGVGLPASHVVSSPTTNHADRSRILQVFFRFRENFAANHVSAG